MNRTRVKFCGITRMMDAEIAVACGVDALGFVFDNASARCVKAERAASIAGAFSGSVTTIALFRDAEASSIRRVLNVFRPTALQFHGQESAEFCAGFGLSYLKAVAMSESQDLAHWAKRYPDALALLLDSHKTGGPGGTGKPFDWSAIGGRRYSVPIVIAGGLNPENVASAITMARPCAVDVSSGIESAPGLKDSEKMQRFMQEVRRADAAGR